MPLKATWVGVDISPGIVETTVSQVFSNDGESVLECTYLFPLPDDASVTSMQLRYADRVVESVVQEKQEAKRVYEKAKAEGKKAALLERFRSNVFSSSVANFAPGETVEIRFSYVEELDLEKGRINYRLPLVTETKYFSPVARRGPDTLPEAIGEVVQDTMDSLRNRMESADTFPTSVDDYELNIDVASVGIPIRSMRSSSHRLEGEMESEDGEAWNLVARLSGEGLLKDFVLKIELQEQKDLKPRLLTAHTDTGLYGGLTFFPPSSPPRQERNRLGRDVIFLIDHSGSMGDERMKSAREGVVECLMELGEADRFNIVKFNDGYEFYSGGFVRATEMGLASGVEWARSIFSGGGTEMQPALSAALDSFDPQSENERVVVFLTDGAVGNESDLVALLGRKLGNARLFTFGIGSAPNEFLVKQMAKAGRGQARFIMEDTEVAEAIGSLFRVLDTPFLSDVELSFFDESGEAMDVDHLPFPVANVYAGHPVQIVFRTEASVPATVVLKGKRAGQWETFSVELPEQAVGPESLETLFGRHLIDRLKISLYGASDSAEREAIQSQIVDVSVLFQLVTEFTSRVAVEQMIDLDASLPKDRIALAALRNASIVPPQGARYIADDDVFELSPFTVDASSDEGYRAGNTLSGSRVRTSLKDLAASISVITDAFLEDVGAVSLEELFQYTVCTEVGGVEGNYLEPKFAVEGGRGLGGESEFDVPEMLAVSRLTTAGTPASAVAAELEATGEVCIQEDGPRMRNEAEAGVRIGDQDYNAVWLEGTAELQEDRLAASVFASRTEIASVKESLRMGLLSKQRSGLDLQAQVRVDDVGGYLDKREFVFGADWDKGKLTLAYESSWNEIEVADPYAFGIEKVGTQLSSQLAGDELHFLAHTESVSGEAHSVFASLSGDALNAAHQLYLGLSYRDTERDMAFFDLGEETLSFDTEVLKRSLGYRVSDFTHGLSFSASVGDAEKSMSYGTESSVDQTWSASLVWEAREALSFVVRYAEMEETPEVRSFGKVYDDDSETWEFGAPLRQVDSRGIDFFVRFSTDDSRFDSEFGYFARTDYGAVYRDWESEAEILKWYQISGYDGAVNVLLRNEERIAQEGVALRLNYSPASRISVWGWYRNDWSPQDEVVKGGNEVAAVMSKFVLWDGSWDRLIAGGGLRYRNAIRFNDGFELSGGFASDLFVRYEFGEIQDRSVQLNLRGMGGSASRTSRFDSDTGAQGYGTFRQSF